MHANLGFLQFRSGVHKQQVEKRHKSHPVKEQGQQKRPDQMPHYLSSVAIKKSLRPNLRNSSRAATT